MSAGIAGSNRPPREVLTVDYADELREAACLAHERQPAPPLTDEQVVAIRTAFDVACVPTSLPLAA